MSKTSNKQQNLGKTLLEHQIESTFKEYPESFDLFSDQSKLPVKPTTNVHDRLYKQSREFKRKPSSSDISLMNTPQSKPSTAKARYTHFKPGLPHVKFSNELEECTFSPKIIPMQSKRRSVFVDLYKNCLLYTSPSPRDS